MPINMTMVILTKTNGDTIAVNPDRIDYLEEGTPVCVTMVDGHTFDVREDLVTVIARVREYRASVLALADELEIYRHPS